MGLVMTSASLLVWLVAQATQPAAVAATRPATTTTASAKAPATRPVAAVWYEMSYPPPGETEPRRLIVGVWADGTVVWSDNRRTGGAPYRAGQIDRPRVGQLLRELKQAGFFAETRHVDFGPDASYTVLAASDGTDAQWLGSWHEPAPANANVVVTEQGIGVVEPGRPRPEPSPEYKRFLNTWAAARKAIEATVPREGRAVERVDPRTFELGREVFKKEEGEAGR
jgi:hypothetical protein